MSTDLERAALTNGRNPNRHSCTVTVSRRLRDRFRRRYWVRCWTCNLCEGPYHTRQGAWRMARVIDRGGDVIPFSEDGTGTPWV